ncbi:MAG: HYR domain-containing protein, partial [Saprospiraceae bacterium]|nr:HYR domain-containing protein [Saprospiraceae bacterium]
MRALFLCICISAAISGVSQPIVQLEYFIDADPGFGMATQVPITTDTVIDVSFSIDLSALAVGAHTLYVRAKDSLDNWSFIQKQAFLYQPSIANPDIAMVEYYVDTDPGLGSASQFTFAPDENVTISQALDLSPLIPGSHTLYVRAKDENGSWSFQQKQAFLHHPRIPNPDITRIEFYIDSDPGLGMADTIPIALSTNVVADTTIDLSPLIVGSHALYARAQDENGDWSFPQKQAFLFDDQKVEFVEFKFDSLPGFGDWVVSNPFTPDFDITADIDFSGVCDLVTGWYYIDARARRQLSWWSKEYRDSIEIKDFYLQTGAVVDQFGDSVELVDLDVQGVGMFVTDAMGTYSFLVPKCWGDTVTLFRDSAYTATNSYVFQNPLLDYSPHHILGDIDSSLYAYKCVNQSGTIPADLDYVCEGANYVVNKAGETIDTGSISGYILHDGLLTLGTIYESNLDGAFLNDGTLPQNQKLYISPVVGRPGQMSLFDADHECTDIMLPGRPVVFLNTEDTVTLVLDSMGMASLNPAAMVTGGCSGCEIMSYGMSQANFGCIDHGINSEFLTVSDGSGNSAVCEVIVVVQDTIVPSFMCAGNATRSTDIDVCTYTVVGTEFDPTDVFDNCPVTLSNDKNGSASLAGAVFDLGTTIITWTVDDQHGNTSTCTLSVTVEDNQAPQIVCANAVRSTDTGQCTYTIAGSELDALPSDNCTDFTFVNDSTGTNTLAGMTLSIGVHVITWTVDDQHGQTATCSMTITVEDNESPVITCAANATRDTDSGVCTYTVSGSEFDPITVSDNCTDLTYTNDLTGTTTLAGEVLSRGVHVITWTVDDQHGQTATCAMTITVEDNEVPAITCPSSGVRAAEPGLCNYTVTGTEFDPIAVTDNCPDYVFANTYDTTGTLAGTVLPLGVHNITWVVNDLHGQFGLCDITITVEDTQPPSITCPADVTLAITAADCDTSYVYVAATSDNCSGEVVDVLSG